MKIARVASLVVALILSSEVALAQGDTGRTAPPVGRGRGGRIGAPARPFAARKAQAAAAGQQMEPAERQAAIRQIRQAMNRKYRVTLGLNDQQMRTLNQSNQRYERQSNELLKSERETRRALIATMADTTSPRDQGKINGFIDQLAQAKRKQLDLAEAEQKELSTFLNPYQRAQYLGLKEQLDRKIAQFRQQNAVRPAAKAESTAIPPTR
jgi:hypothetical protein